MNAPVSTTAVPESRRAPDGALSPRTIVATIVGAVAILVSGWVHFYLYFRGGYRGIAPESMLGLTISRSFALNAIAAVVLAEAHSGPARLRGVVHHDRGGHRDGRGGGGGDHPGAGRAHGTAVAATSSTLST